MEKLETEVIEELLNEIMQRMFGEDSDFALDIDTIAQKEFTDEYNVNNEESVQSCCYEVIEVIAETIVMDEEDYLPISDKAIKATVYKLIKEYWSK